MNKFVFRVKEIISHNVDVSKIRINIVGYTYFLKLDKIDWPCFDPIDNRAVLKLGHYATYYGVEIHVNECVPDNMMQVCMGDDTWSKSFPVTELYDIKRIMNLKAFW